MPNTGSGAGVDRSLSRARCRNCPTRPMNSRRCAQSSGRGSDIRLGSDASEAAVKHASLSEYRVVYFATHGLVAGDVKGLAEPSLALSVPKEPTSLDDGLLTASEVAQLKLNADWVVLSACNTAAGDKPGAEALSGLRAPSSMRAPRSSGVALGGRLGRGDAADHVDLRSHEVRPEARPGRGVAARDAGLDGRPHRPLECLSGHLGAVRHRRRRRPLIRQARFAPSLGFIVRASGREDGMAGRSRDQAGDSTGDSKASYLMPSLYPRA